MNSICQYLSYLVFFLVIFISCKTNIYDGYDDLIVGKWDVYASEMNESPNQFMQNGFFEFLENNEVKTNVFQKDENIKYSIHEDKLRLNVEEPFDLKISKLTQDSLILEGKMRIYYMKFYLIKAK